MTEYEGQPEYVHAGFMVDLLEPWCMIEGSEWGRMIEHFHAAAEAALSCSSEGQALTLVGWIMEELDAADDQDWWEGDYESQIKRARRNTPDVIASWREQAVSFKGEDALEAVISALPEWIKFDPERDALLPQDDPEYRAYKRLKKKFE